MINLLCYIAIMNKRNIKMNSDKFIPRLLGMMFLVVVILGILSGLMLGSTGWTITGQPDNISETMISFSDNPTMVQMSK